MVPYIALVFISVLWIIGIIFKARECCLARRLYGTTFMSALSQMFECWMLSRRRKMMFISIMGLWGLTGYLVMAFRGQDIVSLAFILYVAFVSVDTFVWNLQPPGTIFLAASGTSSLSCCNWVNKQNRYMGFRTVYLLQGGIQSVVDDLRVAAGCLRPSEMWKVNFAMGNCRTVDDNIWKCVLRNLVDMTPLIVVDLRNQTEGVSYEVDYVLTSGAYRKTIFVADEGQDSQVLLSLILKRIVERGFVRVVKADEDQVGPAIQTVLSEQFWHSTENGQPFFTKLIDSKNCIRFTPWARLLMVLKCLGAMGLMLVAFLIFTTHVNSQSDRHTDERTEKWFYRNHGVYLVPEGVSIRNGYRVLGVSGGVSVGVACCLLISGLLGLRRPHNRAV